MPIIYFSSLRIFYVKMATSEKGGGGVCRSAVGTRPRSLLIYAAPIWFHNASSSQVQKLQAIQISSLVVTTVCVKITSVDHLHEDTKMNPIQDHIFLIGSQYLARALQPNNPFHSEVTFPSGIKNKTKKISFNLDFSIVLFNICRTVFYPPLIMGPPSSPFTLKQFPISNLFQLITVSFRMLSRK